MDKKKRYKNFEERFENELKNAVFGQLIILDEWYRKVHRGNNNLQRNKYFVKVLCSCTNETYMRIDYILNAKNPACGCGLRRTKHGAAVNGKLTPLYKKWSGMIRRCHRSYAKEWNAYGGRGIKVCDEWHDFNNFRDWALHNGYKENLTIERIDVNGNYCPENCEWIPMEEQHHNVRRPFTTYQDVENQTVAGIRKTKNGYHVRISVKNKEVHLGATKTYDEAAQLRMEGEEKYWDTKYLDRGSPSS